MHELILAAGILALIISGVLVYLSKKRVAKIMDTLEDMLHQAMSGSFFAEQYDESRLSKIECAMSDYLSASAISAQNVEDEKNKLASLISDISHQTKTPLANLVLYGELLEQTALDGDQRQNTAAIRMQTEKLQFLIDALVKLSRLENGIIVLSGQLAPLSPLLHDVCLQLQEKANAKGITLTIEDTDVMVNIDPKWTQEAIFNIVDNAVKYTDKGSVSIRVTPYDMFTRIDVTDTGIGIPMEEQSKVFGRFYRAESARLKDGVGIGLHLAREIISREGGYIKVCSTPGQGSVFSVFLPKV